jgi:hypothetical protein
VVCCCSQHLQCVHRHQSYQQQLTPHTSHLSLVRQVLQVKGMLLEHLTCRREVKGRPHGSRACCTSHPVMYTSIYSTLLCCAVFCRSRDMLLKHIADMTSRTHSMAAEHVERPIICCTLHSTLLHYAVLCCAVLCCAVLCCLLQVKGHAAEAHCRHDIKDTQHGSRAR